MNLGSLNPITKYHVLIMPMGNLRYISESYYEESPRVLVNQCEGYRYLSTQGLYVTLSLTII